MLITVCLIPEANNDVMGYCDQRCKTTNIRKQLHIICVTNTKTGSTLTGAKDKITKYTPSCTGSHRKAFYETLINTHI